MEVDFNHEPGDAPEGAPDGRGSLPLEQSLLAAAVVVGALLAFHGLTNHVFWDDEANTGIFARNLLRFGELTGWDGQNLIGYRLGAELDQDLVNVFMPRLQYDVAALGFRLFGESTFGGRVLFVLCGVATLFVVARWARRLLGPDVPVFVPAWILATSPAFLLYIRNARYYALGLLLTAVLFWAASGRPVTRVRRTLDILVAVGATWALILTHYIYAASALAGLAFLFVLRRYRTRHHVVLAVCVFVGAGLLGTWILLTANPFVATRAGPGELHGILRFGWLVILHARDLLFFEFTPVAYAPILFLPFHVERVSRFRSAARVGLWLVGLVLVSCVVTSALVPEANGTFDSSMRYLVPVMAASSMAAAVALTILWSLSRRATVAAAMLLAFTNIPYLSFLRPGDSAMPGWVVRCRLCDYVRENARDYETPTELLIRRLRDVPDNSLVLIQPTYMAYSPMFYLPDLRFCCQLTRDKDVTPRLPDYVYRESADPDVGIVAVPRRDYRLGDPVPVDWKWGSWDTVQHPVELFGTEILGGAFVDGSRPEIPWHTFSVEESEPTEVWVLARPERGRTTYQPARP